MGDPFLNYFALFLLIFVVVVLFYGIIAIHDIPYNIAASRDHPHQDAIHAAGWVGLLHCTHCGRFLDLGHGLPSRSRLESRRTGSPQLPGRRPRNWRT